MRVGSSGARRLSALVASLALLIGIAPLTRAIAEPGLGAAPDYLTVSQRSTMAIVTWPASEGAQGYAVEYDMASTFTGPSRVTTPTTVAVLVGLAAQTTYHLRVAAWDRARDAVGPWSAPLSFTTAEPVYPTPAPLVTATSNTNTSITLDWDSVAKGVRYEASIGRSAAEQTEVKQLEQTSATFTDLARETAYFFRVRAVDAMGEPVTAWSAPLEQATPKSLPLRVGTYNILCENCSGGKASWAKRRGPLVAAIRNQDLDVLGVQEASIGRIPGGGTQYGDLINRLGSPYKLTEYGRSASPDNRIIYNSQRIRMLRGGVIALPKGASRRYLAWAILKQKSTGKRFFFSSTHLEPADGRRAWNTRRAQATAIVNATRRLAGDLPVISVGDFASTKWEKWGNAPYEIMESAGYHDPLGNGYRTRSTAPTDFVEKRINTSYASYNMYKRQARRFTGHVNGSNNDYIFLTHMRVAEYEVVVRVDSAGRFIGVIPSDHNLLRATVYLP